MSDSNPWTQQLTFCISSSDGFRALSSQIHSIIQTSDLTFVEFFMNFISGVVSSKQYSATQRFNALYLLLKATEKGGVSLLANELVRSDELLNFLFYSAQHESAKKIALDERGKYFFTNAPPKSESRIGINFVRLCLECFIIWQKVFGVQSTNHSFYAFHAYCNSLKKKIKMPTYFYYIGRDYSLFQDLATWNYFNSLPQLVSEYNLEANSPKTPGKNSIFKSSSLELTLKQEPSNESNSRDDAKTQKTEKDASLALAKEESDKEILPKIEEISGEIKSVPPEFKEQEKENKSPRCEEDLKNDTSLLTEEHYTRIFSKIEEISEATIEVQSECEEQENKNESKGKDESKIKLNEDIIKRHVTFKEKIEQKTFSKMEEISRDTKGVQLEIEEQEYRNEAEFKEESKIKCKEDLKIDVTFKEEKDQKISSKRKEISGDRKVVQPEDKNLLKVKEEADGKFNNLRLKLENIATDNFTHNYILTRSLSVKNRPQKAVTLTRQKTLQKEFANDLLKIQDEIARSNSSYSSSPYNFHRQNAPEIKKKPSLKTFNCLFQDNVGLQTKKPLFHVSKELHDGAKSPQINSLIETSPLRLRVGLLGSPKASITPSPNRKSALLAQRSLMNKSEVVYGFDYLSLSKEQRLETEPNSESSPKSIIEWIDQDPAGDTEKKVITFPANKIKIVPMSAPEFSAPSWKRNNTVTSTSLSSPKKILKFGLVPVGN